MEQDFVNFVSESDRMNYFFRIVLILLIAGCNRNQDSGSVESQTLQDTTVLSASLQYPNEQVILVPEAREITIDWLAYVTAQNEIENFRNYTVSEVIANASPIAEIMNSLRETVPDQFKTNAIQTRLSVLYTKAKVLEHLSNKKNRPMQELVITAEELPVEFNNFKIQLNELYLKTLEDFELELDEFEVEDSLVSPSRPIPAVGEIAE